MLCDSRPRRGALRLRIDISYEYMEYEVAVYKGRVWQLAVGADTDDSLLQTYLTLCYEILGEKKSDLNKFLDIM